MPVAPLWYPKTTVAYSDKVTDVKVDAFEQLDLVAIKVSDRRERETAVSSRPAGTTRRADAMFRP